MPLVYHYWEGVQNRNKSEDLPLLTDFTVYGLWTINQQIRHFSHITYSVGILVKPPFAVKSYKHCLSSKPNNEFIRKKATMTNLMLNYWFKPKKRWIIILLILSTSNILSNERADSVKQGIIPDAVITAGRVNSEIIPSQQLSGEQLKRLSAHSVADALRYFSGVQIKDYGGVGGLKTVNVRSLGSQHVGVFYDGIELGNAQNGVVDLGRFSLDNMAAISVYNGQKSVILQPAKDFASASSIYMTSLKPSFEKNKKSNINLGFKAGSFKTLNPTITWEQRLNNNLSSTFSSGYIYTSGEYRFRYARKDGYDTTELRKNGDVKALRVEGSLIGNIDQGEWKSRVYYYKSERGYPGASVREEPGKFRNQDRQWDNNFFIQGSFRKNFTGIYSLLLNGKYARDYLHYISDPRLDVTTMYINNTYLQHEIYISIANQFSLLKWLSISLSSDLQLYSLKANLTDFVYPQRQSFLTSAATSLRLEKIKIQASILHSYVNEKTRKYGTNADNKSELTPSFIASYKPFSNKDFNLRAFYKRIFRMPTMNDLYYTFIGNKNLKPEYTNQYNIGFTYGIHLKKKHLPKIWLQLDCYFNEIEDKIIAMPTSNQFRWTMINLGYTQIRGIDVAMESEWQIGKLNMNTRLNYTYQKAQDLTDNQSDYYGGQIPYIPWHSGSLTVNGNIRGWNINYSFIYTGERYDSVANIPENYTQPWYTHDFSFSRKISLKNTGLRLTAEINNIFNQPYEVVKCYPMPGINFNLKLNIIL